jgi:hypothetical protein
MQLGSSPRRLKRNCRSLIGGTTVAVSMFLVLARGLALAEAPAGSIIGWGDQVVVAGLSGPFTQVAAGGEHSLGLRADGSIVAWGLNDYGQANVPAPNADFIGVAAGARHSVGLKSDGSLVAWGCETPVCDWLSCYCETKATVPSPNMGFVAIAAGSDHSLALRSDGSVVEWGCNPPYDHGQCNIPSPNVGFIAVAAGDDHSLGLKSDGSIVAWGDNEFGQTDVPAPNADFVGIAAGEYHSVGVRGSKADYNDDGKFDTTDYAVLWSVIDSEDGGGPGVEPTVRFWYLFDMDADRDVDLMDVALFENAFTGE